jgi:hypothetical protein
LVTALPLCFKREERREAREERREAREEIKTISLFMLTNIKLIVIENDIA